MSFTSDYLKRKNELEMEKKSVSFPSKLPTQSIQKTAPAATNQVAGATSNGIVSTVVDRINQINNGISPEIKKAFRENKYASSSISAEPKTLPNVGRELAFARRTRAGGDTIKNLQEQQNAYLQQQRQTDERNIFDDIGWGLGYGTERIAAGLLGPVEGVTDFVGSNFWNVVGGISSLGGNLPNPVSEYANQQAAAFLDNSITRDYSQSIEERYKPNDAQRTLGNVNEAVAAMLPSLAASYVTGGGSALAQGGALASGGSNALKLLPTGNNLGRAIMGVQAAGSSAQDAYQEGADLGQSLLYGTTAGLLETTIESLAGGIPGLGKGAATQLAEKMLSNPTMRKALDIIGEGGEEAISAYVTPYIKRQIYDPDAQNATPEEIIQNALMGMAVAGVLQGGIELPSALSTRSDVSRQATENLSNPDFVQRTTADAINQFNQNVNNRTAFVPDNPLVSTLPTVSDALYYAPGSPAYRGAQTAQSAQTQQQVNMQPSAETSTQRRQGVQIPVQERTWQDAGNRKVNAFQYDHPELRPYYAEAARALKYDLASSTRGERFPILDANSTSGRDIIGYTGTKRSVTEPIAQALDNANLSYAQIDKAIDDLIADNGQENYAAAKKLELVLDDMLTNGYTDSDGYTVPPNQEYIAARDNVNAGFSADNPEYRMSEAEFNAAVARDPAAAQLAEQLSKSFYAGDITQEEYSGAMDLMKAQLLPTVESLPTVGPESSVGAARKGFDPYSAFLGTKSEFFPEGANAARPVDVPNTDVEGNPIRKTAATAMGAKAIPDEVVGDIQNMVMSGDLSYKRVTDRDSINRAISRIKADGFQRALGDFSDAVQKGVVSKDMATLGQQLLVNAANAGDANATAEILSLYAQMETVAGQAVQAASILRKLSPTAQLYAAQKVASNLEKTLSKQLKGENITINPDLITEFNEQTTQEGRDAVMEKIYKDIASQVPSTWKDKWNALRYLSMLGNPRTHFKNIFGNVGFQPVRFMKDRIAAVIESGVSAASGGKLQRTKSFATNPALYAAAWQDFDNVSDALSGNKYDDVQSIINDNRTIFKTKPLEALRKANTNALSIEDMWFKRITYAGALSGYLNANGVTAEQLKSGNVDPNLLSAARDYAGQEALKATYNDKNAVSDRAVQIARSLGVVGEAVLPFKRTPANILVRGFEYSPLWLVKGLTYDLYQVKQGNMTGAQAIDNIAAGMTGTGLMLLGGLLAAAGVVSGGAGDDEKQAQFNELTGGQTYALNLPGGGSVTLDWLAPEALPFFMGVQAMESFGEEGLTGDTITSAFASISEPMLEMSMLQSLNDLIDNVSYAASNEKLSGLVGSSLISYLTQAIPTIGGQIERTFEDKRYSTYTNKDSILPTGVQYALGKASAKIPIWDFQQVPYIDAWGREEETGLLPMRALNNFLNPAYTSSLNVTPVDEEIQRLYNATGVGSVIPSRADKSITVDGEDINLSGDKYVEYAKTKGGTAFDLLSSIIDTSTYKGLSDDEKVKLISDVYEYANSVGKAAVSSYKPEGFSAKVQSTGVDPADYILYRSTADADNNGTVTQSEAASALLPMKNLSNAEKGKVWQSQNSSWNEKKNPFSGALASAGIDASTATSILNKYSEVYNMDIEPGEQAAELSKFLDSLNLTADQRTVVDDTYKFYNMFPATIKAYNIETMSKSAKEKWPRVQAWGMSEEDYLKYYPMVSSGKKADCLQKLQNAGMTQAQANYFWSLVKSK